MRPWRALLLAALLAVTSGLAAGQVLAAPSLPAHASVWKADPAIGSTIARAPMQVSVFALESIRPQGSSLQVYGPGPEATDTLISQGQTRFPLSDSRQMSIAIAPVGGHVNGVYIVFWQTVSADDNDPASGSFTFTVAASAGATATPARAAVTTPAPASTMADPWLWVSVAAALLALCAGLGAGFGLGRRRRARASLGALRASVMQAKAADEARERP